MIDEADLPASISPSNPAVEVVVEEALRNLWSVANTLSRIKPTKPSRYRVTVFGSARIKPGQQLYEEVKRLAKVLAERGCDIVTGGGPGLMQAANEGALLGDPNDETKSIGVRIALPFEQGANPFVEQVYTHDTFYTRLHQFVRLSDAFVVVGGGIGTALETLLIWQLLQVRHLHDVPLIFVGEMWSGLLDWARSYMLGHEPQLASPDDMDIPTCVPDVDAAIELLGPKCEARAASIAKEAVDGPK